MAWFAELIGAIPPSIIDVLFTNLVFGSCWLFICIAKDITQDVIEFNEIVTTTKENRTELTKQFCDLVQIYSNAKE